MLSYSSPSVWRFWLWIESVQITSHSHIKGSLVTITHFYEQATEQATLSWRRQLHIQLQRNWQLNRYADNYSVCWVLQCMLTTTVYADNYSVCWQLQCILTTTVYAGNYSVCWQLQCMLITVFCQVTVQVSDNCTSNCSVAQTIKQVTEVWRRQL